MASLTPLPRLMMLFALTLAVTVAAGVATPRLRVAGRERVVRPGLTRSGSWRSDGARGWTVRGAGVTGQGAAECKPAVESSPDDGAAVTSRSVRLPRPLVAAAAAAVALRVSIQTPGAPARAGRAPPLA